MLLSEREAFGRSWFAGTFATERMKAKSLAGCAYTREVWTGVPRIPDQVLRSTFYLYRSVEEAVAGRASGGTGFFVSVSSKLHPTASMTFAVTNWHVAVRDGHSCIRVNKAGGGIDVLEFGPDEWTFRPAWHDLAIIPVDIDFAVHDVIPISEELLASVQTVTEHAVGPGDDLFMVGRFMDHDGGETNAPAVRFGNLSMMPHGFIKQPTKASLESYCIDMHSRTGHSGSPVFVYRTHGNDFRFDREREIKKTAFIYVLGIHWGQFIEHWELGENPTALESQQEASLTPADMQKLRVKGLSGMGCVIPSAAILELLHCEKFEALFVEADIALAKRLEIDGYPPEPEAT